MASLRRRLFKGRLSDNTMTAHRQAPIQRTLKGVATDAFAALSARSRPDGEVKPDPPNEDFGYEYVGAGIGSGSSLWRLAAHLEAAASFNGIKSASPERRSFKRLLDPNDETTATPKTLYLFGAACWTLGARYASGSLALAIAGQHLDAVSVLAGTKPYAVKYGVVDELSRYAANLNDLAKYCALDNWIEELKLFDRPLLYEEFLMAVEKTEPRKEWANNPAIRERFLAYLFANWKRRESTRLANALSPISALCMKQSYLNMYYGNVSSEFTHDHVLLLAAKQEAVRVSFLESETSFAYPILADYLREDERFELEMKDVDFGINPDKLAGWFDV